MRQLVYAYPFISSFWLTHDYSAYLHIMYLSYLFRINFLNDGLTGLYSKSGNVCLGNHKYKTSRSFILNNIFYVRKQHIVEPVSSVRMVQTKTTFIYDEFLVLLNYGSSHISCMIQHHGKVPENWEIKQRIIISCFSLSLIREMSGSDHFQNNSSVNLRALKIQGKNKAAE